MSVQVLTLAEAIDDYLHLIVRVRPWTKRREEEALLGFAGWLGGEAAVTSVTPALVARYAEEAGLDPDRRSVLRTAVHNLHQWVRAEGV